MYWKKISLCNAFGNYSKSATTFKFKTHYSQAEKYGKGEMKNLKDGRIRYYGNKIDSMSSVKNEVDKYQLFAEFDKVIS